MCEILKAKSNLLVYLVSFDGYLYGMMIQLLMIEIWCIRLAGD